MPFASAQIGRSFRNEISPRAGLLRVREFTMAEIEHYVDPNKKNHSRFNEVSDTVLRLLPANVQLEGSTEVVEMTIGDAVKNKVVDNETLGYFLARIHQFLTRIGMKPSRLRFRQHMSNEMAHYACDCWDCEIHTSYGWIECVGCADRSAYDLTVHSKQTKEKLVVREVLPEPRTIERWMLDINRKAFGVKLKKAAKPVEEVLNEMTECDLETAHAKLAAQGTISVTDKEGNAHNVDKEMVSINKKTITEHGKFHY